MDYPKLIAELSLEEKRREAKSIFHECLNSDDYFYSYEWIMKRCQHDFKTASLTAYLFASALYNEEISIFDLLKNKGVKSKKEKLIRMFEGGYDKQSPITAPYWAPVIYCGGNIEFGRVFSINHCAFSSHDSIIGFGNSESNYYPCEDFKILKGLKYVGVSGGWTLLKLDKVSTDDMTGMIYLPLEKNFMIEFAHFPHKGGKNVVFRWEDC